MDYFDNLNKIIYKIEEKLTEKIEYKELAKIIGTSTYTMQRIFVFLTGITIT
ncbi:MAG: helix-turn-helix transcriptional regulator [Clostridia bacterium]|nr:helix-turn-helix transcriptional regulator [Clostridia bacterium]